MRFVRTSKKKNKAVALISSGLDSLLSAKIVGDLGIHVHGVHFYWQFDTVEKKDLQKKIVTTIRQFRIPMTQIDITNDFIKIVAHPEHGYGSEVNPCIDCRILMLRRAKELMDQINAQFLITGEVIGQRPMTQNKPIIFHIEKVTELKGLILRPLSAQLLPPTFAEEKGLIDREKLYGISGRSRKTQLSLACKWGMTHYSQPAGGCILTDPGYARRLRTFFSNVGKENTTLEDLKLMHYGRHFWPRTELHVVVGRNQQDNQMLKRFQKNRWTFLPKDVKGPLILAKGVKNKEDLRTIAGIAARYCNKIDKLMIQYHGEGNEGAVSPLSISDQILEKWRV
jgi:tRNA-specific 2-thiouridylase